MKILVAGGFLGKTKEDRATLQPSPEAVLVRALEGLDENVCGIGLKDWRKFFKGRSDVVHIHHMSKMAVIAALVNRRMVFTHHSAEYSTQGIRRLAEWVVWRCAARVVCLSQTEEAEKLALFPCLEHKTCVIPNAVVPVALAESCRTWDGNSRFVIASVGQLIELKRVSLAIESLTRLPPNFVLEVTYHNDALEGDLRALAADLGVQHRVRFLGRAAGRELAERYGRAHMLLLTSRTESLPSVVTEALMAGMPVVATAVGAVEEQVGSAGICVQLSDSRYDEAILRVASNYGEYARRAHVRGMELAQRTSEAMALQHLELYRSLFTKGEKCG